MWVAWVALAFLPFRVQNGKMTSEQIDALWNIDDAAGGLPRLRAALADHPGSADEIHTQICRCLGLQRKFAEGWDELGKVSASPSAVVAVRVQLESGRLKNTSGDKRGAEPYFRRALDLARAGHFDYYAVDAAHMLAIVTSGTESIKWNEDALRMAALSKDARARKWRGSLLNNLGWTYHDGGDFGKALEKFEAARAFQVESGDAVSVRIANWAVARCLRSMKRFEEALTILRDLVKFPEKGYASEELAENLLALGRVDEAKLHFRRAYELLSADKYLAEHEGARLRRLRELAQ